MISVVVLAAGEGTRMKSRRAKVLHCAGGMPLVEHVLNTAAQITPEENIVVVVGHQAEEVKSTLAQRRVRFVLQEEQRGTGHAAGARPTSGICCSVSVVTICPIFMSWAKAA